MLAPGSFASDEAAGPPAKVGHQRAWSGPCLIRSLIRLRPEPFGAHPGDGQRRPRTRMAWAGLRPHLQAEGRTAPCSCALALGRVTAGFDFVPYRLVGVSDSGSRMGAARRCRCAQIRSAGPLSVS
jgi:hypothetical protein